MTVSAALASARFRLSGRHRTDAFELGRRPAIDGLRAVAIVAVVGVHVATILVPTLSGHWFIGGVIGVNVFFVISGFLITSLLLEEHRRTGRVSLASFWKRRSLRLFPALYLLLIVQFFYTLHVHDSVAYTLKGDGLIVGYVSNWAWVNGWPQPFGLGNTWSLGVEEQFYLFWPLMLIVLLRFGTRVVGPSALIMAAASVMYRSYLYDTATQWWRPIADTRAELDALMIGVFVAWALHTGWRPVRKMVQLVSVPAAGLLAYEISSYPQSIVIGGHVFMTGHWLFLSAEIATAVLLLAVLEPRGPLYLFLNWFPVRWLGRLSYSLYLWHVFVFYWLVRSSHFHNSLVRGIAGILISVALAMVSFYFVERPFVRMAHRSKRPARIDPLSNTATAQSGLIDANGIEVVADLAKGLPSRNSRP